MVIFLCLKSRIYQYRKQISIVLLLCCLFLEVPHAEVYAEENISMYSGSYALVDGDTGRMLTGKKETVPMANASTTKILTCIVTLENVNMNDLVVISANAASQPRVRLGMKEGEVYPIKDLLYGLMLESYNDCAVAIAEHMAGSEEEFSKMLNEKAKEIGCMDTYFITPNGLDAESGEQFHHTTALDLCHIMAYCTWKSPQKEKFLEITQTRNYNGSTAERTYSFVNRNAFLDSMDGVVSGKTGFTNKAGYCYVAALERDGERYCIALLACGWPNNKTYKWKDARTLFEYGLDNYEIKTARVKELKQKITVEGYIDIADYEEINQRLDLQVSAKEKEYKLLMKENETLETELLLYTDISLPIQKGQKLGECKVYLEDILIDTIILTAEQSAESWKLPKIMILIFGKYLTFSS